MRYRLMFGAALVAGVLAACGGSSSETPPPLQPDPAGFHYASAAPLRVGDETDASDAGAATPGQPTELDPSPRAPARSTWGSGAAVR